MCLAFKLSMTFTGDIHVIESAITSLLRLNNIPLGEFMSLLIHSPVDGYLVISTL